MPIWHQSPKLTPRYFLETPRLFGYPLTLRSALTSLPKPVPFHLKFVMLHNDSSFSQILLSNCCQMRSDIMVLDILYLILVQLCTSRDVVINHQ